LVLVLALAACAKPQEPATPWKTVDAPALRSMMAADRPVTVINTMSEIECLDHRIPGSLCIPCEDIEAGRAALPPAEEQVIVLYCESEACYRSCRAAEAAVSRGYGNVYILKDGMPAWKEAGFPVETVERVPRAPIRSVKAPALKNMMGQRKDLLLIDIRSEGEFREGHIPGAVNIPMYRMSRRYAEIPFDRQLVLIDNRGFRTFLAGSYLERKGYKVLRLFGGMKDWNAMESKPG